MAAYETLPKTAKSKPTKFEVSIPEEKLQQLKQLVKLSPIAPETYENLHEDRSFGISRSWLQAAKQEWGNNFDWRAHEKHINSFPHYKHDIRDDDGKTYSLHYVALFSEKPDAVPIVFLHGWPGSFLEFLPMLSLLKARYKPAELPYHVIVPSLVGFGFSARPPLDRDWTAEDTARLTDRLMRELGFEAGYVAQGGDIGSFLSRLLCSKYASCKAMHINVCNVPQPPNIPDSAINELERKYLPRGAEFMATGAAYAIEQGTRPSTIGLVLSTSPLALLAWIGEKFLTWTDADPTLSTILESVSLYWLTDTYPTSIYTYRQFNTGDKPFGFSWFPYELAPVPRAWAATTGNLVFYRQHDAGGHFAALEKPKLLLRDVEDFVGKVWAKAK
ncbi:uncharacterized protein K452DRAFT_237850 [Aplosporella prunicola CBS 121167]|uniref:Epoxide hydrolase N-terminal domain-containing protein n=1 Tax=Aplosporella prunicola CBS 121167 TaxID=1176127 RepID=A0A6A6AWW9_9PEZI|nr:uncharacterized protein K452DRAFT_237850 [Aplosporella prunicola CBS 121167]KAF2136230.1 hypothetical protein K452DRAFT_237850 [Aplosporella prunicola CBS 121167]